MSRQLLRISLLTAAGGALVVLVGLLGSVGGLVGLGAIGLGTLLAAPAARGAEGSWWLLLAVGAATCAAGLALSLASDAVGGLLLFVGGASVLLGAALGFPG